jgi:CBS domain-containing protein
LAKGQDLQALKAEDIMTSQPVTVEETATAEMVINQMIEHQRPVPTRLRGIHRKKPSLHIPLSPLF